MFTPRVLAVSLLIVAVLSVSACGSTTNTTTAAASGATVTAASGATVTHNMNMTTTHRMPTTASNMPGMKMGSSQPENDAAAVAALKAHDTTSATRDLRAALASTHEPAAAKRYARRALGMLGQGKVGAAQASAIPGASVEHLTYALAALRARDPQTAAGHLMEAAMLPPSSRAATAAIAAINAHNIARATSVVTAALHGLGA